MNKKKWIQTIVCVMLCILITPLAVHGATNKSTATINTGNVKAKAGWKQNANGKWKYLNSNGTYSKNKWQFIKGQWYHFDSKGIMQTGWLSDGGKMYYLKAGGSDAGRMLTGWRNIGGSTFYFKSSGETAGGFTKIGSNTFYFKKLGGKGTKGKMLTGWQTIKNNKYYFKKTGAQGTKGKMFTGWHTLGGKKYYFNSQGIYSPSGKKKLIAIDAGHQRKGDSSLEAIGPGASTKKAKVSSGTYGKWSGLNEYELNLTVSKKLKTELLKRGYDVYMIRETHDVNISNSQRAKNAAKAGADILVRIHANGDSNSSVYGALTMAPSSGNRYLTSKNISASQKLSKSVINSFSAATGAKNRSVLYVDNMSGINWSTIPVTIVEMGFMSNKSEDLNMAKSSYQDKMVQGIANGIDNYYK